MMIAVRYRDGSYDRVKASSLDHLLATNQVELFWRSSGPVLVGRDPIRKQRVVEPYWGKDRRAAERLAV